MALLLKVDPVGIDRPIDKIQQALYTGLVTNGTWTMYESYHRAYKNETKDGIVPEIFTGKKDYKDAFTDDGFTATSFFLIPDEVGVVEGQKFQAEISIIFQVDLAKLYPNAPDSRRFDEEMHNEILNILNDLDANFTDVDYVTSLDSVYAGLDTSKIKWNDLQPYHVVRFTVTANYDYQCNPVFAKAGLVCTIGVDMSKTDPTTIGGSDGTATATPTGAQGSISYEWDDPANQTTQTATGLEDGTYTCIVTDSIISIPPCNTLGMIELEDPAPICTIGVTVSVTDETGSGLDDGTADATPSGGQGTLTYAWTGPNSFTSTLQNITGLEPGLYTVIVTDDITGGCTATDNGTVDEGAISPGILPNLNLWVDATDIDSFNATPPSDLDPISAWNRQTGSIVDLIQVAGGSQPIYNDSGFGTNDTAFVGFNGTSESLLEEAGFIQAATIVMAMRMRDLSGTQTIFAGKTNFQSGILLSGADLNVGGSTGFMQVVSLTTNTLILKVVLNGTSSKVGLNGDAMITGDAGVGGSEGIRIGTFKTGVRWANMEVAEIIQYGDAKSDADLTLLTDYLNNKYGIF